MATYDTEGTPASNDQRDGDSKKISFRFCRECSNMLYPKEDRMQSKLMFACRTCQFSEEAGASCIYRNSLKETIAETPGNVQDVAQDPTVGNANSSFDYNYDTAMDVEDAEGVDTIPDLCTYCGQEIVCPICEGPTDGGLTLEANDPEAEVKEKGQDLIEEEKRERALSGAGLKLS
ncbi:DNA-directed RNA polymerase II core subunit rpb9 [Vermiconidia calcicola]|uniref:DNA-directed RNA polymerase II core subunit rpb9 n=1 Tax=Vermiconidia calcicola TaxID=1690605 RepID=A0ACC3MQJ7_9PEZI|nr:DNA-directed RNA polymerase II core subunit rpb9 [Vermiconidia calcicola]